MLLTKTSKLQFCDNNASACVWIWCVCVSLQGLKWENRRQKIENWKIRPEQSIDYVHQTVNTKEQWRKNVLYFFFFSSLLEWKQAQNTVLFCWLYISVRRCCGLQCRGKSESWDVADDRYFGRGTSQNLIFSFYYTLPTFSCLLLSSSLCFHLAQCCT